MKTSPADAGQVILDAAPQRARPHRHALDAGLVLRGKVITAVDDRQWSDGGVAIDADGRVHAAGAWEQVLAAAGPSAQVADHRPHWIVPGMVDLHVHLTLPGDGREGHRFYADETHEALVFTAYRNANAALRAGVTTLRDCGGRVSIVVGLRDAIRRGLVNGPRLFVAGPPMTITGGHCHYMGGEVDGVERVRHFARSLLKAGVDYLKMMGSGGGTPGTEHLRTTFSLEELRAAKEEAHRAGTHLAVHATNRDATRLVVEAGVDTIEHAILGTLDGDRTFTPDIAENMARQGCIISPTFQASLGQIRALEARASAGQLSAEGQRRLDYVKRRSDMRLEHCGLLGMQYGVPIACSTDAGWSFNLFGDFADGLDMMASVGFSARETFRSATEIPARALGKAETLGHLRPGAWGDAVVLRGNPLEDIKVVRQVEAVYLGGQAVNLDG